MVMNASPNCRCRRCAPVVNLAHSASFHACEKTAPSKPGIKQLGHWPLPHYPVTEPAKEAAKASANFKLPFSATLC